MNSTVDIQWSWTHIDRVHLLASIYRKEPRCNTVAWYHVWFELRRDVANEQNTLVVHVYFLGYWIDRILHTPEHIGDRFSTTPARWNIARSSHRLNTLRITSKVFVLIKLSFLACVTRCFNETLPSTSPEGGRPHCIMASTTALEVIPS